VQPEGLRKKKKSPMIALGIDCVTFQLVLLCDFHQKMTNFGWLTIHCGKSLFWQEGKYHHITHPK
jgi:hypothetical protein